MRIDRNAWLLAVASGVLQALIFPSPNLYWLCWIALAPLLLAVLRARPGGEIQVAGFQQPFRPATPAQGFVLGYVSGVIWYLGTCYWVYNTMHVYGGLSVPVAVVVMALFCLYLALYHGVFGFVVATLAGGEKRAATRRALFLAPFVWVALELARARITGFPWDLLGTVQVGNIPLNRVATFTGVYGLSFEIALVNTVFAAAFLVVRSRRKIVLIDAVVVALVLQLMALIKLPGFHADRRALLVQSNIPILPPAEWTEQYLEGTLSDLVRLSTSAVARGGSKPDLVVWPESPSPFYVNDPRFRQAVAEVAKREGMYVLAGSIGTRSSPEARTQTNPAEEMYNSAALMAPDGTWVARYDKIHLVPFGEYLPFKSIFGFAGGLVKEVGEFTHGSSREPFTVDGMKIGVFICYESVFPHEVREFANKGAQVFVNISNDGWYGNSSAFGQHLNQARMRAIENQRWLLRDTNTGVTASIDPYGRIVAQIPRDFRMTLNAPYGLISSTTFYTRHGDWFAYACAIISLGALLWRSRSRAGVR